MVSTYPIGCPGDKPECTATAKYTNNTGWVDFIITPVVGTLWMLGEDTADRFISGPLVHRYPYTFGYKMLRAGLNPSPAPSPTCCAATIRGFRDEENLDLIQSIAVTQLHSTFNEKPNLEGGDLYIHYNSFSARHQYLDLYRLPQSSYRRRLRCNSESLSGNISTSSPT